MKQQTGFVLISVLIITTITSMLALAQINENLIQERIGGNQQKEINARLEAEKILLDAFEFIEKQNEVEKAENVDIETALNQPPYTNGSGTTLQNISIGSDGNTFSFESKGVSNGATAYLKAEIEAVEASGVFKNAITTCELLALTGSGKIDSYNGGAYSDSTKTSNGSNVIVTDGNAVLGNATYIGGSLTASGTITGATSNNVAGTVTENYSGDSDECNPLDISSNMPIYTGTVNSFTAAKKSTTTFDGSTVGTFSTESLTALGEIKEMYVFQDFASTDNNNEIKISGDVIFYIKGNMTIKNTTFSLVNNNSSLTIYINGNIVVDTGSNVFANDYVNNGNAPLTVYSSNSDDTAVTLGGNGQIYMNLYAPKETVAYNGSGAILGSLRAKDIDIGGSGDIHYDEGLREVGDSTEPKSSYKSVYYSYE